MFYSSINNYFAIILYNSGVINQLPLLFLLLISVIPLARSILPKLALDPEENILKENNKFLFNDIKLLFNDKSCGNKKVLFLFQLKKV